MVGPLGRLGVPKGGALVGQVGNLPWNIDWEERRVFPEVYRPPGAQHTSSCEPLTPLPSSRLPSRPLFHGEEEGPVG